MSVYFVYRSQYEGPSGKHIRRFKSPSVLGWFQFERLSRSAPMFNTKFDSSKAIARASDHIIQFCLHTGWAEQMFDHWIIFDDLWAGEHRALANGILRFAKRWDVLTR